MTAIGVKGLAGALAAGALFGVGLAISGMTMPEKVVGFLDLFGAWDPTLAFVMMGAIAVHFIAYRIIIRRPSPLFDRRFDVPTAKAIDARLVLGAAIFGIGWALAGFCPGPALVSAASGSLAAVVFVVGMTIGTKVEHLLLSHSKAAAPELRARETPR